MLLIRTLKLADGPTKTYYTGITYFFFTHGTCRLLYLLKSTVFPADDLLSDMGTVLGLLSVVLIVYSIERTIFKQSRSFFTIFGLGCVAIQVMDLFTRISFLGYRLVVLAEYLGMILLVPFIIIFYVKALRKSPDDTRRNAIAMLCAIILLSASEVFNSSIVNDLIPLIKFISPLLMVIALLLLYYAIIHLRVWKANQIESMGDNKDRKTNEG
ncbi:MAG: hypothetical protein ACTSUE_00815 [Promethearchaeota archaeon]